MSKISFQPNAVGSGTFTIASPNSGTNRTLTLPDETGTVLTSASSVVLPKGGDAVFVRLSGNVSVSHNVATLVPFNSEDFDSNSSFNTGTSKFQPSIAGYYFVSANIAFEGGGARNYAYALTFHKNGSRYAHTAYRTAATNNSDNNANVSAMVYLNGSTDFISTYFYQYDYTSQLSVNIYGAYQLSYFSAFLVRAA